jgi:hypothetical protein
VSEENSKRHTLINVCVVDSSQALYMCGISMVMIASTFAGHTVIVDKSLPTFSMALQFVAAMIITIPASVFTQTL